MGSTGACGIQVGHLARGLGSVGSRGWRGCREGAGKPTGALSGFVRRPFAHCSAA
ncbi:hypothetical protein ACWEWG_36145 [Streptomyces sp. NPDC003758]